MQSTSGLGILATLNSLNSGDMVKLNLPSTDPSCESLGEKGWAFIESSLSREKRGLDSCASSSVVTQNWLTHSKKVKSKGALRSVSRAFQKATSESPLNSPSD